MENWITAQKDNFKQCSDCKETKLLIDFYKRSNGNGYRYLCKKCQIARFVKTQKIRRHENGISKAYREKYDGRSKNEEYRKFARKKYKYLRKNAGPITLQTIKSVYDNNIKQFGTLTCYLCLKQIVFGKDTLEHKIPISRNGTNGISNLAIACLPCNVRKYNRTYEEYVEWNKTV